MQMELYIKPSVISYKKEEILDIMGPAQSQSASVTSVTIETWRGAKLDNQRPIEYRIAEIKNIHTIVHKKENVC